LEEAMIQ